MRRVLSFKLEEKIQFILLCGLAFYFWFSIYRYHIVYQEKFTLFLYSSSYFFNYLLKPGGLAEYMGLYFIQFFRHPIIGVLLYTISFGSIYLLTSKIIQQLGFSQRWSGLIWIPAIASWGMQMHYDFLFTETIKVIFYYLLFYIYLRLNSPLYRQIYSVGGAPLFFLLLGGGIFMYFYISLLVYEIYFKRIYFKPIYIVWIILLVIIPFI